MSAIWESANWTQQFGIRQTGNWQFGMLPRRYVCIYRPQFVFVLTDAANELLFSSPDPKGHVSYSHHLASVVVVRRKLFQKSSPLKVLDQWKPNLV